MAFRLNERLPNSYSFPRFHQMTRFPGESIIEMP